MKRYDWSKVSRAGLERVCKRAHEYAEGGYEGSNELDMALYSARAEAALTLRTRAEVDADMLACAKAYAKGETPGTYCLNVIDGLWKEETQD